MQAYLLDTGRRISPFDEPVGEMRVHNRRLRDHQTDTLEALGCQVCVIDDPRDARAAPCLLIHDDVYFTYFAAKGFLAAVRRQERTPGPSGDDKNRSAGNFGAALTVSPLTESFVPSFQGRQVANADGQRFRAYDFFYLRRWGQTLPPSDQVELLPIPHGLMLRRWRVNRHFDPSGSISLPLSPVAMCPVQHWSSLLAANILGMPSFALRALARSAIKTAMLPLSIAWRTGSPWPSRLRGKLYLAGAGCKVHPTAHVEGAVLGRGVRIGPHAVVRGSVLADRVEIGPGAIVECSTLGEKVTVNGNVTLRSCVAGDGANIGAYFTQLSVVGRGAALCPTSALFDFNLRGSVNVSFDGRSVASGSKLLGGCAGHGAFLGAEVVLAPGQELPNGCILVRTPREVVGDVRQGTPPGVIRMDRGTARQKNDGQKNGDGVGIAQ